MIGTLEYRSDATGRRRRPSTTRSMLKGIIRRIRIPEDVRTTLRQRLELMGRGSGDTERFFLDEIPGLLLEGLPEHLPVFMHEFNRVRMRNRSSTYTPVA